MDNRTMHAQIQMGNAADEWMKGPLGQYVLGRCEQIINRAKDRLTKVDPRSASKIQELQTEIWKAGALAGFLNELLAEGRQALETLESSDDFVED
jgi:hypothetical protein